MIDVGSYKFEPFLFCTVAVTRAPFIFMYFNTRVFGGHLEATNRLRFSFQVDGFHRGPLVAPKPTPKNGFL